ncbi:MAG: MMPL family transporter [Proteobacteria bacterium]|nr:MMPL family transporter [Pseudomonadota bacterium]
MSHSSLEEAPRSAWLAAWAKLVLRFRIPVLLLTLFTTGVAVQQVATRLTVDTSQRDFLASGSVAIESLEALHESFGTDEVFLVLVDGDVFSMGFLDKLKALHDDLERIDVTLVETAAPEMGAALREEGRLEDDWGGFGDDLGWGEQEGGSVIETVTSLVNVRDTVWLDGTLNVGGLLDTWPTEQELPALKKRVLADSKWVGNVVDADGEHAVLVVKSVPLPQRDLDEVFVALMEVVDAHNSEDFPIQVGGPPALFTTLNMVAAGDFLRLGAIVSVVLVVCMFVMFRRPIGVLGPLGAVGHAVAWTLGIMVIMGRPMTIVSAILWPFLLCVGIGGTIHIQSVYRDSRRDGLSVEDAVVQAVATTGVPVLLTSATTVVGLLSFWFASAPAIQELGLLAAFGVSAAWVQAMTWLPAVLSFAHAPLGGGSQQAGEVDMLDRVTGFGSALSDSRGRRTLVLAFSAVMVVSAIGFTTTLDVTHDSKGFLPADDPVVAAVDALDAHIGGTNTMSMVIEVPDGGDVRDRELMLGIEKLEQHLLDYVDPETGEHIVTHTSGSLDVVRESWRALNGGEREFFMVPDTQRGVIDSFTLFETGSREALRRVMTLDHKKGLLSLRVKWRDSRAYRPLVEHMYEGIDTHIGEMAIVRPTGSVLNHHAVESALIGDLTRSFGAAAMVITLLMMLMLGEIKLGLLAMIPNLAPIAMVLGSMGFLGINLDVQNLLVASIVIGIAVDDTVHFMHQFRAHRHMHGRTDAAIAHAFSHAGRAIVTTSVVLILGFMSLALGVMVSTKIFALLTASAVGWALFADLVLAPALLRAAYAPGTETGAVLEHVAAAELDGTETA